MSEPLKMKTSLGTIVVTPSSDPNNPGVYIDLVREGYDASVPLALVETTSDEADQNGECKIITRVWGDAEKEDYTVRVVHENIERWFKVNVEHDQAYLNKRLIQATKNNKPKEMLQLIKAGADVNCKDAYGIPVALWATNIANSHTLELLVEHGADVNARKPDGTSKLMLFASYGDVEDVSYLLEHGADPYLRNKEGKDALCYAKTCASWCDKCKVPQYQKVIDLLENAMR